MRRFLAILVSMLTILVAFPAQAAVPDITVYFNGRQIHFDSQPIIENGRTLVPFRAIFEQAGATVGYDNDTRTVTASRGDIQISMTIGNATANVRGRAHTLDVAPKIVSRRTLVPLRFVSEAMGAEVKWDGATRRIDIIDANWPPRGGSATIGVFTPFAGIWNPHIVSNVYDSYVTDMVFSGLWTTDLALTPRPVLASHWTVSEDNRTITFYLRDGVRWHDGTPLTAEDVHFSFMAFMDANYKGARATGWDSLVGYEEFKAGFTPSVSGLRIVEGGKAIAFELKEVNAPFFIRNTGYNVVPKHLYQNVPVADWGTARDPNQKQPIGSGPWKFKEYQPGQFVVLERNADYVLGAPYLDQLILKVVAQEVTVGQLEVGGADYAEVPLKDLATAQNLTNINVVEYPDVIYQYMGFNTGRAPFNDVRVRQAVAYAIDKPAIIDGIMKGHASEMLAPIHPLMWPYNPNVERYDYNLATARALLDQAGWQVGSDGIRVKDGKRLTVSLLYPIGNVNRENTAPVVQQMLKQVGIEVTLDRQEFAVLLKKSTAPLYDYDLLFLGFRVGLEPDPQEVWGKVAIKEGGFNRAQWTTERSEELMRQGQRTMDLDERKAAYGEWQRHFMSEIPSVQLYAENRILGVNKRLGNFKQRPFSSLWNTYDWYIKR